MRSRRTTFAVRADVDWGRRESAAPGSESPCADAPLDCVLMIDDTGSMSGAIASVKLGVEDVVAAIEATGTDARIALVTFKDRVTLHAPLERGNANAIRGALRRLNASGGRGTAEASDVALELVLSFDWRPNASRIVVLVTDAPPGGTDDRFAAEDEVRANTLAVLAAAHGIRIASVYVPTSTGTLAQAAKRVMQMYATVSEGVFIETERDGTNLADAVVAAITSRACPSADEVI